MLTCKAHYLSNGALFPCLHNLIYEQEEVWENSRQLDNSGGSIPAMLLVG